jgi:SAM-dependent methyltransferase
MNTLSCEIKPDWAKTWEDGIMNAWSRQFIINYGSIEEAWNQKAAEYEGDMKQTNRALFVEKIMQHNPKTIVDVGAGTGVFAIPLARNREKVVAVEPSKGMLDILRGKAEDEGLTNIEYINKRWEDVATHELLKINGGKYDAVICSHALYYITDLHHSLRKMDGISGGSVHLLTGGSHNINSHDHSRLWARIHGKPAPAYPDYSCLYMVLREIGLHPDIEMLNAHAKRHITSMDDLYDRWKEYLEIDSEMTDDQKDAIQEYVADRIIEDNGERYLEWKSQDALIHWTTG